MSLRSLLGALLVGAILVSQGLAREEKKEPKKGDARKKGTVVGTLTAKGPNWIEVKADGEEKGRRYVPHWRGGLPKNGGGPDKKILAIFKSLTVGSRIRVEWVFEERARAEKIEVIKAAGGKDKPK